MEVIIYALDVLKLNPDDGDWRGRIEDERLTQCKKYKRKEDRARCIGAGLLLSYAFYQKYPDAPFPKKVLKDKNGKPYFKEYKNFHFNISHSGRWVVCACASAFIGVDIEKIDKKHNHLELAENYFTEEEQNYLSKFSPRRRQSAFFELWALKESYMKATGLGLRLPLKDLSVQIKEPAAYPKNCSGASFPEFITITNKGKKTPYVLALCSFSDEAYRLAFALKANGKQKKSCAVKIIDGLY